MNIEPFGTDLWTITDSGPRTVRHDSNSVYFSYNYNGMCRSFPMKIKSFETVIFFVTNVASELGPLATMNSSHM